MRTDASSVRFILDFNTKSLKIVLARLRGGKETIAEVPHALFAEASLAVCFGGKGQRVTIGEIKVDTSGGDAAAPVARDVFVEAMGQPVAPLTLGAERGDAEASAAARSQRWRQPWVRKYHFLSRANTRRTGVTTPLHTRLMRPGSSASSASSAASTAAAVSSTSTSPSPPPWRHPVWRPCPRGRASQS